MKKRTHVRSGMPREGDSGSAMVLALIVVLLAALFTSSTMQLTTSVTKRQSQEVDELRAFYLAEAGLSEAFEALRVGKRGQVGSIENPAVFGDGFVWVDANPTADGKMRLEATAVCGTGRSALALVVEPVEIPLGIFSDEDLVLDTVLLVDAVDPPFVEDPVIEPQEKGQKYEIPKEDFEEGEYLVEEACGLVFHDDTFFLVVESALPKFTYSKTVTMVELGLGNVDLDVEDGEIKGSYASSYPKILMMAQQELGILGNGSGLALDDANRTLNQISLEPVDSDAYALGGPGGWSTPDSSTTADPTGGTTGWGSTGWEGDTTGSPETGTGTETTPAPGWVELDANDGALIGSNGSIIVGGAGESVQIHGDVVPGVDEAVSVAGDSWVSGETDPRNEAVELKPVEVPVVTMQGGVTHDDMLPLVISPGTVGYDALSVAADSELIIRGPATVVIGTLELAPGAELTLDTQDGDVELFLTGALDLAEGSIVTTSQQEAEELTVQVSRNDSLSADPAVQLKATSQFYGTIYAPEAEVVVGSEFELYGSIAARVLDLEPGARLHYDDDVSDLMPRLLSWRVDEVPAPMKQMNPWAALDRSQLAPLAEAHDLGGIELHIDYVDKTGGTVSYSGAESSFDWGQVTAVDERDRTGWADWDESWYSDWWKDVDWNYLAALFDSWSKTSSWGDSSKSSSDWSDWSSKDSWSGK